MTGAKHEHGAIPHQRAENIGKNIVFGCNISLQWNRKENTTHEQLE